MAQEYTILTSNVCNLIISTSNGGISTERRFQKSLTIADLKGRLELLTGVNHCLMKLELYDKTKNLIAHLENENALLGSYPVDDGMTLLVIGQGPIDDGHLSNVDERIVLSEEDYAKKQDTLRAYLMRNKLRQYADDAADGKESEESKLQQEEQLIKSMTIDRRCQVTLPGKLQKLGTIKYLGKVHFKSGFWIGVQYDEPLGKNDGSVDGRAYFKCLPKYGAFIKPQFVIMGDFPEEDLEMDEM